MTSNQKFLFLKVVLIFYSFCCSVASVRAQTPTITSAAFYFNNSITNSVLESVSDNERDKRRAYILKITGKHLENWHLTSDYIRGARIIQHSSTLLEVEIRFRTGISGTRIESIGLENSTGGAFSIQLDTAIKVKTELF